MTSWWLDVGSPVFSQLPALDAWSVLQFVCEKLFEGLLQAVAVVVIG